MKTKILTLALFGIMSLSFMACADEEIAPVNDVTIEQSNAGHLPYFQLRRSSASGRRRQVAATRCGHSISDRKMKNRATEAVNTIMRASQAPARACAAARLDKMFMSSKVITHSPRPSR